MIRKSKPPKPKTDLIKTAADAAEKQRRSQYEEGQQGWEKQHEVMMNEHRTASEELQEALWERGENIVTNLEKQKEDATTLVKIIGNIGVTGNFRKVADSERFLANIFQVAALALMLAIVGGIGATVTKVLEADSVWQDVILRLGVTVALAIPAMYCAKVASGHRRFERQNRILELQLASIDPFLEALPVEERNRIKAELANRFLGG